ncbi:hypothetical protein SCHPADRAFT_509244 [Schizopora paradoxa]|uniref:Uncharacterized protein n=1 Tax=Schizopora paradoxa TaxID=27342 RepID=A0A0H2RFJ5_9AGAM|nr:hypothetical protein SCHPADRAFT_509244 [Schizopora paradoxa]
MPGVSFRDLLCCSAKGDDGLDLKPPRILPVNLERNLEAEKTSGGVAVNDITIIKDSKGVTATEGGAKVNDGGASGAPATIRGTTGVPADDENGPVQRMRAWFNAKNGKEGVMTALEVAKLALESASGILGNLSVPGAEFSISVVLSVINNAQVRFTLSTLRCDFMTF